MKRASLHILAAVVATSCGGEQAAAPPLHANDARAPDPDSGTTANEADAPTAPIPVSLSANGDQTCAVFSDGTVTCWGMGTATTTGKGVPTAVQGASQVSRVSVGGVAICVLSGAAAVDCFGDDTDGTVGDGNSGAGVSVATPTPALLPGPSLQVAVGGQFACALGSDSMVRCWGANDAGQLGTSVAIGQVSPSPATVAGAPAATAIAVSDSGACALAGDGTVTCWGSGDWGELGDGMSGNPHFRSTVAMVEGLPAGITQIAAGELNVCAVTSSGDLWCWGANDGAQLGQGVSGPPGTMPSQVGISQVAQVAVGDFLGCAVITDGSVQCWGTAYLAASGDAPQDAGADAGPSYQTPMPVRGIPLASQVVIGNEHTCILGRDATVWCWGANGAGQIGPNAPVANDPPTQVPL